MIKAVLPRLLRLCLKPALSPNVSVPMQRLIGNSIGQLLVPALGTISSREIINGVPVTIVRPKGDNPRNIIIYLHGGGYVMGGVGSHGRMAGHLAKAANAEVWLVDYRLAPEHVFPAALEDALAVYTHLLSQGRDPAHITIAGDSAGGGLTLGTAVAIRGAALPQPAALVLISPWIDLSLSGDSHSTHAERDPMLSPAWLASCADAYRGKLAANNPNCSPLFANLRGLPPTLIQVGSEEILLSDSEQLFDAARKVKLKVELQRFDGLWHVFQLHAGMLAESDRALRQIGQFISQQTFARNQLAKAG